ncbi:unnamed protein product [Withania somnifera]
MALAPAQEEKLDGILAQEETKKQKYPCLSQLGPCSTKYCDATCCTWGCNNNYNGMNPVAQCLKIPGLALSLCACYHDCFND